MEQLAKRFDDKVLAPYLEAVRYRQRFHSRFSHVEEARAASIAADATIKGPFLEKAHSYLNGGKPEDLGLSAATLETLKTKLNGRNLYSHQEEAIKKVLSGRNVIVATGTSSGKTLCYQIPIIEDICREPGPGLRAILIYPLNVLAGDQYADFEGLLNNHPKVTYARFTGQTPKDQAGYEQSMRAVFTAQARAKYDNEPAIDRYVAKLIQDEKLKDAGIRANRLNHRDAIRATPPNILITNFSQLELLLSRPIDAGIFSGSRLKFLVLDEIHTYRGVQATEIAFLVRRIKDALGIESLSGIGTSATLGDEHDPKSRPKVAQFAADIFGGIFDPSDVIYGLSTEPKLSQPSHAPRPQDYIERLALGNGIPVAELGGDENLYRLKKEILKKPILLKAAAESLWPKAPEGERGLQALLELVAQAEAQGPELDEDLLPTRLHYFVKSPEGLYVCLNSGCPGRFDGQAAFFGTRHTAAGHHSGECPACAAANIRSKLVEVVVCRKCGWLYGALQDQGPATKLAQMGQPALKDEPEATWDSFSTELGWGSDAFYTYFTIEPELPHPGAEEQDEEDQATDKLGPIQWCAACGKKLAQGAGDLCQCESPLRRTLNLVHRQCRASSFADLERAEKTPIHKCPNCATPSNGGFEPLRRLQESDDEAGLAMAVPLAHFNVGAESETPPKLLCFADNRQRAATFPTLLEEETFDIALGRKLLSLVRQRPEGQGYFDLGTALHQATKEGSDTYDPRFRLPISRLDEDQGDSKATANNWLAEVFGYFAVPDATRDSAEDLGLVQVDYVLEPEELAQIRAVFGQFGIAVPIADLAFQTLASMLRRRKAITLPPGKVAPDAPAFGSVDMIIAYRREVDPHDPNKKGWLPKKGNNEITLYLGRLLKAADKEPDQARDLAASFFETISSNSILKNIGSDAYALYFEKLLVKPSQERFVCSTCGFVTPYSAANICPNHRCGGTLEARPFETESEGLRARWMPPPGQPVFGCLSAQEHTAQINKEDAKGVEDDFKSGNLDILSSTTTFEAGVSIGDLQQVLLRNAPPSTASYVQRIGRAGRGRNKNAVCVTLCRRSRYDLDQWENPERLMSGRVNPAAVFLLNTHLAQRHANALLFSKFLRKLGKDTGSIAVRQKVPLEGFLSPAAIKHVPEAKRKLPPGTHWDFGAWLSTTDATRELSMAAQDLFEPCGGLQGGSEACRLSYQTIFEGIEKELQDISSDIQKSVKRGVDIRELQQSQDGLLGADVIDTLAKRGFLPRYAFPLDVVTLETAANRWVRNSGVELARDRGLAIAEFAPGTQVVARKMLYKSEGLYSLGGKLDVNLEWFAECTACGQIRCALRKDDLSGPCPICRASEPFIRKIRFIQPQAFTVKFDGSGKVGVRFRRNRVVRHRQPVTHFIESVPDDEFVTQGTFKLAYKRDGALFRYNPGPRHEGFAVCKSCGWSRPMAEATARGRQKHERLRHIRGEAKACGCTQFHDAVSFGHLFKSFCLLVRPTFASRSIQSLAYALQKGVCKTLDVEPSDIGVAVRYLTGQRTGPAEIVLYDLAPGGSGFCKAALEQWPEVLENSARTMQQCSCEAACYECLKSFGNQAVHPQLNRLIAFQELSKLQ